MRQFTTEINGRRADGTIFDSLSEAHEKCFASVNHWNSGWMGISQKDTERKFKSGDDAEVPASDKLIEELQSKIEVPTSRYRVFDAVAGGVPNVPAYLANQPQSMRVRRKIKEQMAPLTIAVDLTSSAGIDADYLTKRGVAILALVRSLAAVRPVTIWAGCGLSDAGYNKNRAGFCWFQLDTSPLDLTRAAFQLTSGGVGRGMCYQYITKHHNGGGGWPFASVDTWRKNATPFIEQWFGGEVLFIPPVFQKDEFNKPDKWLIEKIKQYGGELIEQ